ncbi:hypothetical protein NDU88_004236 [Pleurodeles waltl]|uniref:Uncharacterized protein n=1 Tax=Pleurodeles waltl TaxID=8319 RepID=A0AAV7RG53_PLEWA|nr:hypothetical protein NDU88_004236 [Pleurodeles waltl]
MSVRVDTEDQAATRGRTGNATPGYQTGNPINGNAKRLSPAQWERHSLNMHMAQKACRPKASRTHCSARGGPRKMGLPLTKCPLSRGATGMAQRPPNAKFMSATLG